MSSHGHPHAVFRRAIERGNLLMAETTARELGHVELGDALELVPLIAMKTPARHGRAGARWMRRWLEQGPAARLDDVVFVAGCLSALGGSTHDTALSSLRSLMDR